MTESFSAQQQPRSLDFDRSIEREAFGNRSGVMSTSEVGHPAQSMSAVEQELDDAIAQLGRAMQKAYADGDPQGARIYHDRQLAAIRSRTPEHQQRLHAEVNARLADELTFAGHWTQEIAELRAVRAKA